MVQVVKRNQSGKVPRPKTWQAGLELCLRGTLFDRQTEAVFDGRKYVNQAVGDRAVDFARQHTDEAREALTTMVTDLAAEGDYLGAAHWQGLAVDFEAWCDEPCDVAPWDTWEPEAEPEPEDKGEAPKGRTEDELAAFYKAINRRSMSGSRFYCLCRLMHFTGARVGELLAVELSDIDWRKGTIRIRKSKTAAGRRTLSLPPMHSPERDELDAAIGKWLTRREETGTRSNLLFVSNEGNPLNYSSVARTFTRVSQRAKLDHEVTAHQFRHTYASVVLGNGGNLLGLCKQLGHSSPAVTMRTYAHCVNREQEEAVACFRTRL